MELPSGIQTTKSKQVRYTAEFKEQVVKYVLDNKPREKISEFMREVSHRFGVNSATIYTWMPGYGQKRVRHNRGTELAQREQENRVLSQSDAKMDLIRQLREEIKFLRGVIAKLTEKE